MGAFHQPALVYLDTENLKTLDPSVLRDGFAEVIKYGVILDNKLFDTVIQRNQIWGYANKVDYAEGFLPVKIML